MSKQSITVALFAAIILMAASFTIAQTTQKKTEQKGAGQKKTEDVEDEAQIQKSVLLSNLSALDGDAVNLNSPLARAVVKTEIADVAWNLDKQWARQLLKDAFELALPNKETRRKLQKVKKGDNPVEPTIETISQNEVRSKVLAIARRDPAFAGELAQIAKEEMGEHAEGQAYGSAASAAFQADDIKQAEEYGRKIFEADPSQISAGGVIALMAVKDRGEADKLLLEYIQKLRNFPIDSSNARRIFSSLRFAVSPPPLTSLSQGRKIPIAGKEAMGAYYGFLIESLLGMESREPGASMKFRREIVDMWPFVSHQAPELTDSYLKLEAISRMPGEPDSLPTSNLPTSNLEEINKARYETVVRNAQTNKSKDEIVDAIKMALGRQDYETCRELIDKLSSSDLRSAYSEDVNRREAISLLDKNDIDGAAQIASKLNNVPSLMQVYPQMIKFCVDKKDPHCINSLTYELTRKLEKKSESSKAALILSRVAATVAAKDEAIAMDLLRQSISSANASDVKRTSENAHIVEFDNKAFELLALNNEGLMFQMAKSLDDRLYRYLALAAIYRAKSSPLQKKMTTKREGN